MGCPTNVTDLVMTIWVYAVERCTERSMAKVLEKSNKRIKWWNDLDAPASIYFPACIAGILASVKHRPIRIVFGCSWVAVPVSLEI